MRSHLSAWPPFPQRLGSGIIEFWYHDMILRYRRLRRNTKRRWQRSSPIRSGRIFPGGISKLCCRPWGGNQRGRRFQWPARSELTASMWDFVRKPRQTNIAFQGGCSTRVRIALNVSEPSSPSASPEGNGQGSGPLDAAIFGGGVIQAYQSRHKASVKTKPSSRDLSARSTNRGGSHAMMEYKGYIGKVEFDDVAGIFHGEVVNTRDVITFQGHSVGQLKQAFRDSVQDYLASAARRRTRQALFRQLRDSHPAGASPPGERGRDPFRQEPERLGRRPTPIRRRPHGHERKQTTADRQEERISEIRQGPQAAVAAFIVKGAPVTFRKRTADRRLFGSGTECRCAVAWATPLLNNL